MSEFQPNKEVESLEKLLRDVLNTYLKDARMSWGEVIGTLEILKWDMLELMAYGEEEDESEE